MTALLNAMVQALEAGEDLQRAMLAAAKLLRDCTCQNRRRAESLAAVQLADNAISRWQGATRAMMNIARAQEQQAKGVIQ
jgi:hypothetical protein